MLYTPPPPPVAPQQQQTHISSQAMAADNIIHSTKPRLTVKIPQKYNSYCPFKPRAIILGLLLFCSGNVALGTDGTTESSEPDISTQNGILTEVVSELQSLINASTISSDLEDDGNENDDLSTLPTTTVDVQDEDDDDKLQVTTVEPDEFTTAGYNVMNSMTFQITLGICLCMIGVLLVFLTLMMIYTKYRGWKDRMHITPTVRTGSHMAADKQELMT